MERVQRVVVPARIRGAGHVPRRAVVGQDGFKVFESLTAQTYQTGTTMETSLL